MSVAGGRPVRADRPVPPEDVRQRPRRARLHAAAVLDRGRKIRRLIGGPTPESGPVSGPERQELRRTDEQG